MVAMRRDLRALRDDPQSAASQPLLDALVSEAHSPKGAAEAAGLSAASTLAERLERLFERLRPVGSSRGRWCTSWSIASRRR